MERKGAENRSPRTVSEIARRGMHGKEHPHFILLMLWGCCLCVCGLCVCCEERFRTNALWPSAIFSDISGVQRHLILILGIHADDEAV